MKRAVAVPLFAFLRNIIIAFLVMLLAAMAFAQQAEHKQLAYHIAGVIEPSVYPLISLQGVPIQWNAPTFEGFVFRGVESKKDVCVGVATCYSYDGRGNWQFNLTGTVFCKNTCTYAATGNLVVGDPIELPDGSQVRNLSAILTGTWTDQTGTAYANVLGYFSTYTAPTIGWPPDAIPVPAQGGITIVLVDN